MKAVIYARYSSDKQRESSIDDQVRNCQKYADREQMEILHVFQDQAISGSVHNRSGYQQMLTASETGIFDVLLVDDLSRLSRDDIEMKRIIRLFNFKGLRIIGVADGYDSHSKGHKIHAGMKGLMNELYLDDLREKTHRGMSGQALKGFNCGGRTYGYRNVPIEDLERKDQYGRPAVVAVAYEIHPEQAIWIKRIYEWFAQGETYRSIASKLNEMQVPSSRGKAWATSGVKVMLENEMYLGRITWNKKEWLKNPETGKRVYRKRPEHEWIVTEQPNLRIISDELWKQVEMRRPKLGANRSINQPAQRYLFSGLLQCAECGGNFIMGAKDRYGCSTYKSKGDSMCTNNVTVPRGIVEERLMQGIKEEILTEESFRLFMEETTRLLSQKEREEDTDALRQQIQQVESERANIMAAIKMGILTKTTKDELEATEKRIEELQGVLSDSKELDPTTILPKAKARFTDSVQQLEKTLHTHTHLARDLIRPYVGGKILLHRRGKHLEAEIKNDMENVLAEAAGLQSLLMVAGARFELTTFRL